MANTPSQQNMADAIRALAMDAVQAANSGHPGAPMGMAEMAVALWGEHLQHNPANPKWINRDRFVLSNGHASMILYALLHLTGYDLSLDEIKHFRQLHSKTPGHPEHGLTPGVETTTGPLGQGISNAVGMALAEKLLAAEFNRPGYPLITHHTYVFLGDGCLMEGISHEVCSLAGAWQLNKLIALYDDNGISIDGKVAPWFADDTAKRFEAYGWNVIGPVDGHDVGMVSHAITEAKKSLEKPTLIICKTHIGQGSPNRVDTAKAHGEPLGAEEIALTRQNLHWAYAPFEIPEDVASAWNHQDKGLIAEAVWSEHFARYEVQHPQLASELLRRAMGVLPANFEQIKTNLISEVGAKKEKVASRRASQIVLEALTHAIPELLGGSADLTGSNLTNTPSTPNLRMDSNGAVIKADLADGHHTIGRHINYGVREFGMAAIMNGVALYGGYVPYGGTFLTFSDYSRNAIRMAALMKQRVIHVFTHDSIGLGEDGPTHQAVEHAASLRLIPNLDVWRPADTLETAVAWTSALKNTNRPTALLLSRQALPYLEKPSEAVSNMAKGAYVLKEADAKTSTMPSTGAENNIDVILIATGSEVQLALDATKLLANECIAVRVVSMPSTTVFDRQDKAYQESVLPKNTPKIAVEMGSTALWYKYGCQDVIGIDCFGESAPATDLFKHFGFTPERVASKVKQALKQGK